VIEFIDEVVETGRGITGAHPVLSRAVTHAHPCSPETRPARVGTGQRRSPAQTGVTDFCLLGDGALDPPLIWPWINQAFDGTTAEYCFG